MKKRIFAMLMAAAMMLSMAACGNGTEEKKTENSAGTEAQAADGASTLVYGSNDYTRINPAMDEHGEINILIFSGLTSHDGENQVAPGLAKSWDYDEDTLTYTFHLEENVKWHDGEPFTADDVKFTIEAIMDPDNGSENAPNYEDVTAIDVIDDHTIAFTLSAPNVAFLDYMTDLTKRKRRLGMKKRIFAMLMAAAMMLSMAACGNGTEEKKTENSAGTEAQAADGASTLVYGSNDYTRINPAMDEHGEINILIFSGLTSHDGENQVAPGLAKSWDYDEDTLTYTFHLEENVKWHDGEPFTADDVKFTIEAIMDPDNGSENAPNYEDVTAIDVIDDHTIAFTLSAPNVAFLDYMTMAILPKHLLEGEDMQESDFFRHPIGTGPYKLDSWDAGQAITLVKNEDYFKGAPNIDKIIFKIVPDDNAKAIQMQSGELDLALLTPKDAKTFADQDGYTCYDMKTSDYRGILYNFNNDYWTANKDIIPAINYAIDRQAIIDAVLLGQGMTAYGPLQRNIYNNENVEHYDYNPEKSKEIMESAGCTMGEDGFYYRDGEKIGFVISVGAGDQVRLDIAQAAAQQLKEVGIDCTVEVPTEVDWGGQMAYLIGWGSPFDADDHTYKVFGTDKGANYSSYSNALVDQYLIEARESADPAVRAEAYDKFQEELAKDPAFTFICYIDANYVANSSIQGISADTVMGHHGVGIFWNVADWTIGN